MDFKKHLEVAWNQTLKHLVPLVLMTLVLIALSFTIVLAPVAAAGYFQSILLMLRNGRQPGIQDLFSQMHLFLPLLGFSLLVLIAMIVGFSLLVLPGIAVVLAVAFGCVYMLPLMTDKKMGMLDALKTSWNMAIRGNTADHLVVVILYVGLIAIGSSVFIGSLFTTPFATIFLASIFMERMESQMPGRQDSGPSTPPPSPTDPSEGV